MSQTDGRHASALRSLRSSVCHAENIWKRSHSSTDWLSFKSLPNRYHRMILASKKLYYSNLVSSSSDNPRRLWQTVNKLLHHKSSSSLPSFMSASSLADSFASFFTDKITKLHLSLTNNTATASPHTPSPSHRLLTSPLSGPQLNLKYPKFFLTVPTNSLTPTPYQPAFLKNVLRC